jgi:hypothetical protein
LNYRAGVTVTLDLTGAVVTIYTRTQEVSGSNFGQGSRYEEHFLE